MCHSATKIASSALSDITSQQQLSTEKKKLTNPEVTVQEDHKFNVVIYGIEECGKGTPACQPRL